MHAQSLNSFWLCDPMNSVACQVLPSMGFSRREYWSGFHFLLQGIFLTQESKPEFPAFVSWSGKQLLYNLSHPGSPILFGNSAIADVMLFQEGGPLTHVTSVTIKGNNLEINMHTVRKSCEDEGRDWADISASQRTSTRAGKTPEERRGTKQILFHRSQKGSVFFLTFIEVYSICGLSHFNRVRLFVTPMDCSPPGSFVHGILQIRILAWVAMTSSRGSSQPRIESASHVSCIGRQVFFYHYRHLELDFRCVNFFSTTKWLSYTNVYSFSYSFPLWLVMGYWIQFSVLYSGSLLFIHPIYISLHLLIPNSFPQTCGFQTCETVHFNSLSHPFCCPLLLQL